MAETPGSRRDRLPVLTVVTDTLVVAGRGLGERRLLLPTFAALASVPVLQLLCRFGQNAIDRIFLVSPWDSGLGAPLLIAYGIYAAAGVLTVWLRVLLGEGQPIRWFEVFVPAKQTLTASILVAAAAVPTVVHTAFLWPDVGRRVRLVADDPSFALIALAATVLQAFVVLFVASLLMGRLSLAPARGLAQAGREEFAPARPPHEDRIRLVTAMTIVLAVWALVAVPVIGIFEASRPFALSLFDPVGLTWSLWETLRETLAETREIALLFPGAILLASFGAVVHRHHRGGIARDVSAVFD